MSAYLVATLGVRGGALHVFGIGVYSDEYPTMPPSRSPRMTVMVLNANGTTYEDAREALRRQAIAFYPWITAFVPAWK